MSQQIALLENETNAYSFLFVYADKDRDGVLSPDESVNFFEKF